MHGSGTQILVFPVRPFWLAVLSPLPLLALGPRLRVRNCFSFFFFLFLLLLVTLLCSC